MGRLSVGEKSGDIMAIDIKGVLFDTMKEACERLEISRPTMLRYLEEGFFTQPRRHRQGKGKLVRLFDEDWYKENQPKLQSGDDGSE